MIEMLFTDDAVATEPSHGRAVRRSQFWPFLLLATVPFAVLAVLQAMHGTGLEADDYGQYLMHAQALAEGRPYGDIAYIYSKLARWIGPRLAPPGLPLTLAPVLALFGRNMAVFQAVMLIFSTAFVLFAGLYFAKVANLWIGAGVALVVGLSPEILTAAPQILTDLPFAATVWVLLYVVDRPGSFSIKRIAAITALGVYAVALRPTGIAIGPALLLFTALQYRKHGLRPAVPLLMWAVGVAAVVLVFHLGSATLINVHPSAALRWVFSDGVVPRNLRVYAKALLASHTYPFGSDRLNDLFHLVTVAVMVLGLTEFVLKNYRRFVVSFAISYGMMLMILPVTQLRYLWPLFPVFVFGLLNGVRLACRFALRSPLLADPSALAFALLLLPPAAMRSLREPVHLDATQIPEVRELFGYLEAESQKSGGLRVTFNKPRTLAWETGIPAMGPPRGSAECLLRELTSRGITHVVLGRVASASNSDLRKLLARHPERFQQRFINSMFTVYAFVPAPELLEVSPEPECRP